MVLAENGNMRDYVHGGDVCGEDDDAMGSGGDAGGGGGFADGFDDFFDAAFEAFGFCSWEGKGLVDELKSRL